MLRKYWDITQRITEKPIWYDGNGVPRFEPFHPRMCGVYDDYVALMEIECQACHEKFLVACEVSTMDRMMLQVVRKEEFRPKDIELPDPKNGTAGDFGWGDPPRHGFTENCAAGDTMSCDEIAVVEFWHHDVPNFDWTRLPEHEGIIAEPTEDANAGKDIAW